MSAIRRCLERRRASPSWQRERRFRAARAPSVRGRRARRRREARAAVAVSDERHGIRRVGRVRADAVGLEQLLGVAVVGRDEADARRAHASRRRPRREQRRPSRRRATTAGMTPVWPTMSGFAKLTTRSRSRPRSAPTTASATLGRGHLRLQVVARHVARRGDEHARLALPLRLLTAVEEVGDVRVLLGLGRVELPCAGAAEHLGERVRDDLLRRRRPASGCPPRTGSSSSGRRRARAAGATSCRPRSGRKLKRTAVSRRVEARAAREHDGLDELVGDPARRSSLARPRPVGGVLADAVEDRGERAIGALPALVAVHRVVAADDRRDAVGREAARDRRLPRAARRRGRR